MPEITYNSSGETGGNLVADKTDLQAAVKEVRDFANTLDPKESPSAVNFAGILDLSNKQVKPYNDYDVSTNGTITFSIGGSSVPFGIDYLRVVSDGTTPLATNTNLNSIFTHKYGVPQADGNGDIILPSGTFEVWCYKIPAGAVIQVSGISTSADNLPIAQNVVIDNTTPSSNELLTGSYTYYDADGDIESGTTFKWQVADDNSGTNLQDISGATAITYTVDSIYIGKYLRFAVRPANTNGSGSWYYSAYTAAVSASDVTAPIPVFDPTNGQSDISITTNPSIVFNEYIYNTDGSEVTDANVANLITLKQTNSGGTDIPFSAIIDKVTDPNSPVITITPASSLPNGTPIYLAVNNFEDAAGNEQTVAQSVIWTTEAASESLPYFEDALLYIDAYYPDDFTLSTNLIDSIVNRADALKPLTPIGSKWTYDDVNKTILATPTVDYQHDDINVTMGSHTTVMRGRVNGLNADGLAQFAYKVGSPLYIYHYHAKDVLRLYDWGPDWINSNSARNDDLFYGEFILIISSRPSELRYFFTGEYGTENNVKAQTNSGSDVMNGIAPRGGAGIGNNELEIKSVVHYNRALNDTEMTEVKNYLLGLHPIV